MVTRPEKFSLKSNRDANPRSNADTLIKKRSKIASTWLPPLVRHPRNPADEKFCLWPNKNFNLEKLKTH